MRGPACWALSLALLPVAHTYLSAVRTLPSRCANAGIHHHRRHAAPSAAAAAAAPPLSPCLVQWQQPQLRSQVAQWLPQGPRRRRTQIVAMAEAAASAEQQPPENPLSAQVSLGPYKLPLKYFVLLLLVLQNSLTAILARASRIPRTPGSQLYLGSVAVFAAEVMKLPVCLALIARDVGGPRKMLDAVWDQVFRKWKDTLSMGVPALCYCLQNALFFVALSRLSATSYQLWSQSKTLFTALFFVSYLGRVLRKQQWIALGLLTAGVGLVQYQEAAAMGAAGIAASAGGTSVLIGVAAVLASSLLSGFANVYFEKVVKTKTSVSIWMRNVQLGLFSLPQAASLMAADAAIIQASGALVGFDVLAWTVVVLKALGGLLVAAVVKYADNVLKTYATAIAIVLTCVISCVASRAAPSMVFLQGMAMVIASIFLYNLDFGGAAAADAAPAKSTKLPSPPPEDSEPKTES